MKFIFSPVVALIAVAAALSSCTNRIERITVDVSEKRLTAVGGGRVILDFPVETSRYGTGSRRGSKRTPLGTFKIAQKEAAHRFGPVLRLDGYQGFTRGILLHRNLDGKPNGTNGCCCPVNDRDYSRLWKWTPVGADLKIQM